MLFALIGGGAVALISLIGVFIYHRQSFETKAHNFILPIGVGVFLGIVFFELIPETLEASITLGPISVVVGFLGFYLISLLFETYHHHHDKSDDCHHSRKGATKLLIGDALHNASDGVVIASAFMVDPWLGLVTTIGIALHEIPQEIVEFGILLHAGYTKKKAAILNLVSASSVFVGIFATYLFTEILSAPLYLLTGLAAGNLLYIAAADFIPELRVTHYDHALRTFLLTCVGVVFICLLRFGLDPVFSFH